jgi:glucosamine-6-phosphate deaminase
MLINILNSARELGSEAAELASFVISSAIERKGEARVVLSTGNSQLETLQALSGMKIEWQKVVFFHLDEYMGLPVTHPASFRKYLHERFIDQLPVKKFYEVDVEGDVTEKIRFLSGELRKEPVDLGLIGIGVNGHIAFNDPPADFNTREAYIIVNLDEVCRMQQVNEGWFKTMDDVPKQAVSMTPWQIMQCRTIISCVPHQVKAEAVKNTLTSRLSQKVPATLLKQHPDFHLYIDKNSASGIIPFD